MALEQIGAPGRLFDDDLLSLGRGDPLPAQDGRAVPDLIAEYAEAEPDHIAVESDGRSLTYDELDAWAGRVAARLAEHGVGRGSQVGVLVEPSTAMVAAALGVLRSGAAYVPIDPANPERRVAAVLADAQAACVVVSAALERRVGEVPVIRVEETVDGPVAPAVPITAEDAAYLIHTSGSTGEPKGVLVGHGQLTASTLARHEVYPGRPVFLLLSPLAFDSSVAGLWGTLSAGGRLVVATSDEVVDPERLVDIVHRHQITRLLCVPSLYDVLLDAADRMGRERLRSLDTVIVAGETLPEALVGRHFTSHPEVSLVNEYGPTEATVWASYHRLAGSGPVSIGRPIPGALLYVLDENLRPVARGVEGELYIGGAGVARGYAGRAEATAEAFLEDPFTEGGRMYRTGDIVCWNADGNLDFRGRRDHQVKIRGHRVELGAVEAALRALEGVRDAVVVANEARTQLAGFVVAGPGTSGERLREMLTDRLPAVMVPRGIQVLDGFPRTVNGKADRAALGVAATPVLSNATGSRDTIVAAVAAAWAEVLGLPGVPLEVNFFDLGGNSLTMFKLQNAIESHTGSRPSVVSLFRYTTVAAQAALIRFGGAGPEESAVGMRDAATRRAAAMRARRRRAERRTGQ